MVPIQISVDGPDSQPRFRRTTGVSQTLLLNVFVLTRDWYSRPGTQDLTPYQMGLSALVVAFNWGR